MFDSQAKLVVLLTALGVAVAAIVGREFVSGSWKVVLSAIAFVCFALAALIWFVNPILRKIQSLIYRMKRPFTHATVEFLERTQGAGSNRSKGSRAHMFRGIAEGYVRSGVARFTNRWDRWVSKLRRRG